MTPADRAALLVADQEKYGLTLVFVEASEASVVHVVAPIEDQPGYADVTEWLALRKWRTVCGRVLRMAPLDGFIGTFADERLCRLCHGAFGDQGHRVFHDNTENEQISAPQIWEHVRKLKVSEAELSQ